MRVRRAPTSIPARPQRVWVTQANTRHELPCRSSHQAFGPTDQPRDCHRSGPASVMLSSREAETLHPSRIGPPEWVSDGCSPSGSSMRISRSREISRRSDQRRLGRSGEHLGAPAGLGGVVPNSRACRLNVGRGHGSTRTGRRAITVVVGRLARLAERPTLGKTEQRTSATSRVDLWPVSSCVNGSPDRPRPCRRTVVARPGLDRRKEQ